MAELGDPGYDPEFNEDIGLGSTGRGMDRVTHGPFLAIRNFFENQDEIKKLRRGDKHIVRIVQNEVMAWNEESLNFKMSKSENIETDKRMIELSEMSIRDSLLPEHVIHTMNLSKVAPKWTAIVNVSGRDDIQGGELIFRNWKETKRYDNYGRAIGDDNGQPQWLNELGTLIIFPAIEPWGYRLVVSGRGMKTIINFKGEGYK